MKKYNVYYEELHHRVGGEVFGGEMLYCTIEASNDTVALNRARRTLRSKGVKLWKWDTGMDSWAEGKVRVEEVK